MVYLFDTFCGFPPHMKCEHDNNKWPHDKWKDTSVSKVKQRLQQCVNYTICEGVFPDTAKAIRPTLRFVHIDVDLYESTLAALRWAWPLLVPGGVMVDDDYLCSSCKGAKQAVDEFCKDNHVQVETVKERAILRRHQCK